MRAWLTREVGGAPYWLLVVAPVVLAICLVAVVSQVLRPQPMEDTAVVLQPQPSATPTSTGIAVPERARLLVIGDSTTSGYAASSAQKGFAALVASRLGWRLDAQGVSGTGFAVAATNGVQNDYNARIKTYIATSRFVPDVVVLQGSSNDVASVGEVGNAVAADVRLLRGAYPKATVVLLGPPVPLPSQGALTTLDGAIDAAADALDAPYISPRQEGWFTGANAARYGDGTSLNTAGHAYVAKRVVDDLEPLFGLG